MPYTEQRANGTWRVRYKSPDGKYPSASRDAHGNPFLTEEAAHAWGLDQETDIRRRVWRDPRAGRITFGEWVEGWYAGLDLELSTLANYRSLIRNHLMMTFGPRALADITPEAVNVWERGIVAAGYSPSTATSARGLLTNILGDAVRPGHITSNPAARVRGKGKKGGRRIAAWERASKVWPSPCEALIVAERVAVLSGRQRDFVMLILKAWTGMRWSEVLALAPAVVKTPGVIDVHWKLYESEGPFYWGRPKDGSIRSVHVPMWLWEMVAAVAAEARKCACSGNAAPWCQGRVVLFLGERQHHRRSDFARMYFRPAADGMYPEEGGKAARAARPVLIDAAAPWPGEPLVAWPTATPGEPYSVRRAVRSYRMGAPKPVNSRSSRAALVAYALERGGDSAVVEGMTRSALFDTYVRTPVDAVASWLPVRPGLTPHGLRHGHQTWLDDGRCARTAIIDRMGHEDPTISGVYSHVTEAMTAEIVGLLDRLWDSAIRERFALAPRSPVSVLDEALRGYREGSVTPLFSPKSPQRNRTRLSG